jgi:hypothetical protein
MRGKQIHLAEVADVTAVKAGDRRAAHGPASPDSDITLGMPGARAFENAGWTFVPRDQATGGSKVYLRPDGRMALGTNRLTVRVAGSHSDSDARELLGRRGFTVIAPLKLASNLFIVEPPSGQDAVEAAQSLAGTGEIEFAEPELIEIIGSQR